MNENTSLSVVSVTVRGSENIGLKDICYIDGKCPEQFGNTNSVIYADKYGPGFVFAFFEMSVAGSYAPELRSLIGMRMRMLHRSTDFAHSTGEGILNDINATISREIEKYCEYEKLLPGSISIYSKCIVVIVGAKAYIDRTGDCGTYFFNTSERRVMSKNREVMDLRKGDCYMICSSAVRKSMSAADMQRCLDSNKSAENNVSVVLGAASSNDKIHDLTTIAIKILNANVANTSNTGFYQAVGAHSSAQKGAVSRVADDAASNAVEQMTPKTTIDVSDKDVSDIREAAVGEESDASSNVPADEAVRVPSTPVSDARTTIDATAVSAAAVAALADDSTDAAAGAADVSDTVPSAGDTKAFAAPADTDQNDDMISVGEIRKEEEKQQSNAFGDHNKFVFDFAIDDDIQPVTPDAPQAKADDEQPVVKGDTVRVDPKIQIHDEPEPTVSDSDGSDGSDDRESKKEKLVTIVLGVLAALAFITCVVVIAVKVNKAGNKQSGATPTPPVTVVTQQPVEATELPAAVPTVNLDEANTPVPEETPAAPTEAPTEEPTPNLGYRMHTIAADETSFWSLAAHTLGDGNRWKEIADLNGMENQTLTPGTEIKIPLE